MLVGGVTCPGCLQKDGTQKVSVIIGLTTGTLSPREGDTLERALARDEMREWKVPRAGMTWEDVAKKIAPPEKPQLPTLARMNRSNMRAIGLRSGLC